MLKFFRKYNKAILSVGFAFLMVVFLLPAGVSQLIGDPRSRPAFEYDGGVITQGELARAGIELQVLQRIHPAFLQVLLGVNRPEHWLLLTREAEAGGFVGGPEDGFNSLSQLARTFTDFELSQIYGNDFARIQAQRDEMSQLMLQVLERQRAEAVNSGQPPEAIDRILAKARGVVRLYTAYLNTHILSAPELVQSTRDAVESVTVLYAAIDPSVLISDTTPEPTEDEIREHFAIYKDLAPGEGDYGFGYLREPAVRIEWMMVSRREIDNRITLDPIEVNVHWQRNKDRFGEDFTEARPRVERELREQRIERAFSVAREVVKGRLLQAQGNLPEDESGHKILPEDWDQRRPDFEAIAERIAEVIHDRLGIEIVAPDVLSDPRWLSRSQVAELPVLGFSTIAIGRTPVRFPDLVFSMPAVGGDGAYGVQAGIAFPDPLTSSARNLIYFRVLDARPQSPPESVDEVRDRIVHNLKRLAEYERLVERSSAIFESVVAQGMEDATEPLGVNIIYPNITVTRDVFTRPVRASEADLQRLRDTVLDRAAQLDPTRPLSEAPPEQRYVLVPLPSALLMALMEITRYAPLSLERFQSLAGQVLLQERAVLRRDYDWPFSLERMMERHNVKSLLTSDEEEAADELAADIADGASDETAPPDAP